VNGKIVKSIVVFSILLVFISSFTFSTEIGGGFTDSNNRFCLDLYQQVKGDYENVIISPFSISNAFAMVYIGSEGETKSQISKVLNFEDNFDTFIKDFSNLQKELDTSQSSDTCALNIANSSWIQKGYGILESYILSLKEYFDSQINFINFLDSEKAAKEINSWVAKKTNNKIEEIIKPDILNDLTTLILCNAIWFKGSWINEFREKDTVEELFNQSRELSLIVNMMKNQKDYRYKEFEGFKMLEMPYKKGYVLNGAGNSQPSFSMIVFLPDEDSSLEEFEETLDFEKMKDRTESLMRTPMVPVEVKIPKFRVENSYDLNDPLRNMGMVKPFTADADFSKITGNKDLFISDVIHKTYIEVDENGTEAAAVTAIIMSRGAMPMPDDKVEKFHADRPFMYLIRENKTGTILFLGKVTNPAK